jgi:hypothetical protein
MESIGQLHESAALTPEKGPEIVQMMRNINYV